MNERRNLPVAASPLPELLRSRARPGELFERRPDGAFTCLACAHGCVLPDGKTGSCGVRFRAGETLQVPFGYIARRYVREVETNTVFHVLPGAKALTFGMYGCDLRCPYCHNWQVSQALRENVDGTIDETTAEALADYAVAQGCDVLCAAYNEPMIAAEWVHAVFRAAKDRGLVTAVISDGNATRQVLEYVRPVTDVYRVDLKASSEAQYHKLGGRLGPVLDAIELARALGFWVEVVTLVVPEFNDDPRGLRELAQRLFSIDPGMPWHLNAMMPRYKLRDRAPTDAMRLLGEVGAAYGRGLRFVYASNLLALSELGHTRCDKCRRVLVERHDYKTLRVHLTPAGECPDCAQQIPGIWTRAPRLA